MAKDFDGSELGSHANLSIIKQELIKHLFHQRKGYHMNRLESSIMDLILEMDWKGI
jgi:hypothetical protein